MKMTPAWEASTIFCTITDARPPEAASQLRQINCADCGTSATATFRKVSNLPAKEWVGPSSNCAHERTAKVDPPEGSNCAHMCAIRPANWSGCDWSWLLKTSSVMTNPGGIRRP